MTRTTRSKRKQAQLPSRLGRKDASEAVPLRSLRNRPSKTEKGMSFRCSQDEKKRRKELSICTRSPAPSSRLDMLSSPRIPSTKRSVVSNSDKDQMSCLGKKIEKNSVSKFQFSSPMNSKTTVNRSKSEEENIPPARKTINSPQSETGAAVNEDVDTDMDNEDSDNESPSKARKSTSGDNDDCLVDDKHSCDLGSISRQRSQALPRLLEGLAYSSFSAIDKNFLSDVLVFKRGEEADEEAEFPFAYSCITQEGRSSLRKDPKTVDNICDLYCCSSILDLATQWTFMTTDLDSCVNKVWCPLPATTFYYISKLAYEPDNDLSRILYVNSRTNDLFSYKVIDLVVHDQSHFSRLFLLNTKIAALGLSKYRDDGNDPVPCIIHVNSLPSSGEESLHNTEKCARIVRTFLNQYGKSNYNYQKNYFNKKSMPAYEIKVPRQKDGWSCGFYSLYSRYCLMKVIADKGDVTVNDVCEPTNRERFSQTYFSYSENDVMKLRSDLCYLVDMLDQIKIFSTDKSKKVDFKRQSDYSCIDVDISNDIDETPFDFEDLLFMPQDFKPAPKKKIGRRQRYVRKMARKARCDLQPEIEDDKVAKFHGKLNKKVHPDKWNARLQIIQGPRRRKGGAAASIRSYKDVALRRAVAKFVEAGQELERMTNYANAHSNKTVPKMSVISFIKDPIAEYPDREGEDFHQFRIKPLRIAACENEKQKNELLDDIIQNRDQYIVERDLHRVDELIFGKGRAHLGDFRRGKPSRDIKVQERVENKEALEATNRLAVTPNPKLKGRGEDELDDDDANNIF